MQPTLTQIHTITSKTKEQLLRVVQEHDITQDELQHIIDAKNNAFDEQLFTALESIITDDDAHIRLSLVLRYAIGKPGLDALLQHTDTIAASLEQFADDLLNKTIQQRHAEKIKARREQLHIVKND